MPLETDFLILVGPIFFAFFFQATIGMGAGLISISILSLFLSPQKVIPLICIFQLLSGLVVIPVRHHIHRETIAKGFILIIGGAFLGSYLLPYVSDQFVRLALGVYIFLELLKQRFFKDAFDIIPKAALIPSGAIINGMFGMGGPLFAVYYQKLGLGPQQFRATSLAVLTVANLTRLPNFYWSGLIDKHMLYESILLLPVFILSLIVGHKLSKRLEPKFFKGLIQLVLFCASVSLLSKALL